MDGNTATYASSSLPQGEGPPWRWSGSGEWHTIASVPLPDSLPLAAAALFGMGVLAIKRQSSAG